MINSRFCTHERSQNTLGYFPPRGRVGYPIVVDGKPSNIAGMSHDQLLLVLKGVAKGLTAHFDGMHYDFVFDESVANNGWWLECKTRDGRDVFCSVTIWDEAGYFVG